MVLALNKVIVFSRNFYMKNTFSRCKSIFLLMLLMFSGALDAAISPRSKMMIIDATYSYGFQIVGLFFNTVMRKQFLQDIEPYSEQALENVKRIVAPYVPVNELNDILSCIRQPKAGSIIESIGPCCFYDCVVIDAKILIDEKDKTVDQILIDLAVSMRNMQMGISKKAVEYTDVERAYLILHEYGHKINHHYTSISDLITIAKVLAIQTPLIVLRSYMPEIKYKTLLTLGLSGQCSRLSHNYLERQKEYVADEYAFNMLKIDAPAACIALEKMYKSLNSQINITASDDKPSIGMRVMMNIVDQGHPTIWSRYQHACKVAKKYGWKKE